VLRGRLGGTNRRKGLAKKKVAGKFKERRCAREGPFLKKKKTASGKGNSMSGKIESAWTFPGCGRKSLSPERKVKAACGWRVGKTVGYKGGKKGRHLGKERSREKKNKERLKTSQIGKSLFMEGRRLVGGGEQKAAPERSTAGEKGPLETKAGRI